MKKVICILYVLTVSIGFIFAQEKKGWIAVSSGYVSIAISTDKTQAGVPIIQEVKINSAKYPKFSFEDLKDEEELAIDALKWSTTTRGNQKIYLRKVYFYKSGELLLPPFVINLESASGKKMQFSSPEINIQVSSNFNKKTKAKLEQVEAFDVLEIKTNYLSFVIKLVALLIVIALVILFRKQIATLFKQFFMREEKVVEVPKKTVAEIIMFYRDKLRSLEIKYKGKQIADEAAFWEIEEIWFSFMSELFEFEFRNYNFSEIPQKMKELNINVASEIEMAMKDMFRQWTIIKYAEGKGKAGNQDILNFIETVYAALFAAKDQVIISEPNEY